MSQGQGGCFFAYKDHMEAMLNTLLGSQWVCHLVEITNSQGQVQGACVGADYSTTV